MTIRSFFLFVVFSAASLLNNKVNAQVTPLKWSNDELYIIGKSWGLIKYYHPAVSQGKVNWDSVLIASLNIKSKQPVSSLINGWFAMIDKVPADGVTATNPAACDSTDLRNFDIDWISRSALLSSSNKAKLNYVLVANNVGVFYTGGTGDKYNGKNEKKYPGLNTASYRLLSLFRFWNVIAYFYPYKYSGSNWDQTLKTFIPVAVSASSPVAYAKFLATLSGALGDTHSSVEPNVLPVIFSPMGPPFKFKVVDGKAIVTKLADPERCKGKIAVGDVILTVNGQPVAEFIKANKKYISASNPSVTLREAYQYVFNGSALNFAVSGIRKNGRSFTAKIERIKRTYEWEWDRTGAPDNPLLYMDTVSKKLVYSKQLENDIFFVERSSIENADADRLIVQMKKSKALIFDLRSYNDGNALAMIKIFNMLLPKPTPYAIKTIPDFRHPGKFCFVGYVNGDLKTVGKENAEPYKGKVYVLINEETQSAEEFFAMMFKTVPNVVFVGSQTAGADGNKTPIVLADDHTIIMSGIGIFYPNGRETQRIGIKPDVVVKPTIRSMQEGRDALLDTAIKLINGSN